MKLSANIAAIAAVSMLSSVAFAADFPAHKAAPVAVELTPSWVGLYLGLNAGGAFGAGSTPSVVSAPLYSSPLPGGAAAFSYLATVSAVGATSGLGGGGGSNGAGFLGGGQIGYNWQFGHAVVGLEADIQGVAGTAASSNFNNVAGLGGNPIWGADRLTTSALVSNRLTWLGTVRGRLGWSAYPSVLFYLTGGLAYGGVKSSATIAQMNTDSVNFAPPTLNPLAVTAGVASGVRVGATVGAGVEWMFCQNWSLKAEYLYYDLGSVSMSLPALATTSTFPGATLAASVAPRVRSRINGHVARLGVNYHFNWGAPGPVVASY